MRESIFVYHIDSRSDSSGRPLIRLFGRSKSNKNVCVMDYNVDFSFYVLSSNPEKDVLKAKKIKGVTSASIESRRFKGKPVKAVLVRAADLVSFNSASKSFENVLENDIPIVQKYIVSKGIKPTGLVLVEGEEISMKNMRVDSVIKASSITAQNESSDSFNIAAFDIETDSVDDISYDDKIILISIVSNGFRKSYTWKKCRKKNVKVFDSEAEMIKGFSADLVSLNPDFIVAYNSDGFDLPFLRERARRLGFDFCISKDDSPLIVSKSRRGVNHEISGTAHVDVYSFVLNIIGRNLKTDSYRLADVSREVLGNTKKDLGFPADLWKSGKIDDLAEYCEHDSFLALELFNKFKEFLFELSKLTSTFPEKVGIHGFSALVENYLMSLKDGFLELAPKKPSPEEKKIRFKSSFEGAYVHQPKAGVYENIVQFDFRSMYPSIISAHNIGPDTISKKGFSKKRKGLIPTGIKKIISMRITVKEAMKNSSGPERNFLSSREQALKILANSVYGYLAYESARWYCLRCADEVTSLGRKYIQKTILRCKEEGLETVYGDTDSVFVVLKNSNVEKARKIVAKINSEFPEGLELKFEDYYVRGVFVAKKGGGAAAKKKYALALKNGSLVIKGFEYVRRDWSRIAKQTQFEVLKRVLVDNSVEKALRVINESLKKISLGKCTYEDLEISTRLTRNINTYKSKGPHVSAAIKLVERGIRVGRGSVISYIIAKGSGSLSSRAFPVELSKGIEYDREYYSKKQVIPCVAEILEAFGVDKKVFFEKSQKLISDF